MAGNLFSPPGETGAVDGGFGHKGSRRNLRLAAFGAAAALVGLGATVLIARRAARA